MEPCETKQHNAYLLVEDFVVFVDICDISLILIEPLTRELASLIDTIKQRVQNNPTDRKKQK